MTAETSGLHHVTAIGGDPQKNIDFYITGLGLRLVKKTVNFDDPSTYHLYYGDDAGRPGSLMTFFPWKGIRPGRIGAGQSTSTAFSVPAGSIGWWKSHFAGLGVESTVTSENQAEERLSLRDPDGLQLDLVASSIVDPRDPWDSASVPAEFAVRGQHSSVLTVKDPTGTARVLTEELGMSLISEQGNRLRFSAGGSELAGHIVDVIADPKAQTGLTAGGTVHHIAFRVPDQETQQLWREQLAGHGYEVTQILDRQYFTSIYFREPGGVLFEIATDTPGFDIDEPLLELGRSLKLPPWLEPSREAIEHSVIPVRLPAENNPALGDSVRNDSVLNDSVLSDSIHSDTDSTGA
ncbi:ring-cleaving dioxygenase [Subtercola frigoramans]